MHQTATIRDARGRLCKRLALLCLLNLAAYTVAYAWVGGDAWNGGIDDGAYYVGGHFLHSVEGSRTPVTRGVWMYSYLHSITVFPSLGALLLAVLALARPHIVATFREGAISGGTVVAILGAIVVLLTALATIMFTADFIRAILGPVG